MIRITKIKSYLIFTLIIAPALVFAQGVGINTTTPKSMLDVEGNMAIGATYSGTTTAPANGMIVEGNVGIGTSSPGAKLDVVGSGGWSAGIKITDNSTAGAGLRLVSTDTGGEDWNIISTGSTNGGGAGNLGFYQNNEGYRVYLDSNGDVGIGTTDAGTYGRLEVYRSGYSAISTRSSDASGAIGILASNSSNEVRVGAVSSHPVSIRTANANRIYVESTGNVGIGNSSPGSYQLNLTGYQYVSEGVLFDCVGCGSTATLFGSSNWGDLTIQGRVLSASSNIHLSPPAGLKVIINDTYRAAGGAGSGLAGLSVEGETLLATGGGNVGIGSSTPGSKLDVVGTITTDAITIETGATANYVLQSDASGNATWVNPDGLSGLITGVTAGNGLTGGGTSGTVTVTAAANNGLNVDAGADKIQLGGALTEATTISLGASNMIFDMTGTGDFHVFDAGASFFYIGDNGTIGIGNTSPATLLDIGNATTVGDLMALYVKNTNGTGTAESVSIGFGRSNTHVQAKITASNFLDGGFQHGYLAFSTRQSEVVSERMRIDWLGNVMIGGTTTSNAQGALHMFNAAAAPTVSVANSILLYAQDVSASSELRVRDEAGNVTTLSPHNFSMIRKSEPMAWSYYSENDSIGKKINVDMLRMARLVESISGEKIVFIKDINDQTISSPEPIEGSLLEYVRVLEERVKALEQLIRE